MRTVLHAFALTLFLGAPLGLSSAASGPDVCSIPYNQPNRFLPMIVSHKRGILHPVHNWSIEVELGEVVDIVCCGFSNTLVGMQLPKVTEQCQQQGSLSCNFPYHCTRKMVATVIGPIERCGLRRTSKTFRIGWSLPDGGFLWQVEVCYNSWSFSTEYTKHTLVGSMFQSKEVHWLHGHQHGPGDPYFADYENQKKTVAHLLRDSTLADVYIGGWGPESYLERGLLSPAGDFNAQTWKDATFHYMNQVPMWQSFNNGNWKTLEDFIQKKASEGTPRNFIIYTGTHGVLKLLDGDNDLVHIFLQNGANQLGLPVPEHIWKIVYDEQRKEAIAFVLLNHPSNAQYPIREPPPLCSDVCDKIKWSSWKDRNDKNKGKIYCCTVESMRIIIPNLPIPHDVKLMFEQMRGFGDVVN